MEIVVNKCYGGFGLSPKGVMKYAELSGLKIYPYVEAGGDWKNPKFIPYDGNNGGPLGMVFYFKRYLGPDESPENDDYFSDRNILRDDPDLVKAVKELGDEINTRFSQLEITEIPDGVSWEIGEYDGREWVDESHRSW